MARAPQRFTIYDMMEAKGMFESNPANRDAKNNEGASAYAGPVAYPKMLYHPQGDTVVVNPGEAVITPFGPKLYGERREIINKVVHSAAEEKSLLALGWHTHPAHAMKAAGLEPPETSSAERIDQLQDQIKQLIMERDAAKAQKDILSARKGN
jgi:hypothetical protein